MHSLKCDTVIIAFLLYICNTECKQEPVVNTLLGQVKGFTLTSRLGKTIYSFTSIRYAKAPVDELRFQVSFVTINFAC